jgi:hypothetical protein
MIQADLFDKAEQTGMLHRLLIIRIEQATECDMSAHIVEGIKTTGLLRQLGASRVQHFLNMSVGTTHLTMGTLPPSYL